LPLLVTRFRLALSIFRASGTIIRDRDPRSLENAVLCRRVLAVLLVVAGGSVVAAARDLALVSNKANTVTEVSMPDLVKICKGQTSRWPKGKPVTLFTRNPASPEMKLALEKIYARSKDEVNDLIAAANHGRANHPAIIVVDSDKDLVESVASTPGAVGLVDVYSINGAITVLRVEGKLPLQAGYPLHGN
jgi:ABC-type phosphate transport system substrate-binding protein